VIIDGHDDGVLVVRADAAAIAVALRRGFRDIERTDGFRIPDRLRAYLDQLDACQASSPSRDRSGDRRDRRPHE